MKRHLAVFFVSSLSAFAEPTLQDAVSDFQAGDLVAAKVILEGLAVKEPKNQAVQNYLRLVAERQAGEAAMRKKLNAVIIPKLELSDADAKQAFDFICQLINKNGGFRPNMVWMVPPGFDKKITLSLDNIPGAEAMRYAAESAGLKLLFEEHAVRVKPE